jgi:DNA-directed RNA polymerase subunit E'/Rpb7
MSNEQLVDPFITRDFSTIVELLPSQMDSNYYLHLKKNVENKVVGKCNNIGLFTKVIKLVDYESNNINIENFSANAEYDVTFTATICIPLVNTLTILRVERIIFEFNDYLINADNGSITCVMPTKTNGHFLSIKSNQIYINSLDKYLEIGDYIKVLIKTKKIDPGDKKIAIIGKMVDIATEEEIEKFYYNKVSIDQVTDVYENIQYNDDADYVGTSGTVETADKAFVDI